MVRHLNYEQDLPDLPKQAHLNGCEEVAVLQGHVQAHCCQVVTQPAGRVLHPQSCIQGRQDAGLGPASPIELLTVRPDPCTQAALSEHQACRACYTSHTRKEIKVSNMSAACHLLVRARVSSQPLIHRPVSDGGHKITGK